MRRSNRLICFFKAEKKRSCFLGGQDNVTALEKRKDLENEVQEKKDRKWTSLEKERNGEWNALEKEEEKKQCNATTPGQFRNCPDFFISFPIFRIWRPSGLPCIVLSYIVLSCISLSCILLSCILLSCIALYCIVLYYSSRTLNTHFLALSWEANMRFLGLARETVPRASSGNFLRDKSCYLESFGFFVLL